MPLLPILLQFLYMYSVYTTQVNNDVQLQEGMKLNDHNTRSRMFNKSICGFQEGGYNTIFGSCLLNVKEQTNPLTSSKPLA